MVLFLERAQNLREITTERGALTTWTLSPTIYVVRCVGHLQDAHVDLLLPYSEELVRNAPRAIEVFYEMMEATGYDSSCRRRITSWALDHLSSFERVHVAVRSKLVKMGVQVAHLALRNIVAYDSTVELQVALRGALRAHAEELEAV